jgi:carboxypeptidase PM20D1
MVPGVDRPVAMVGIAEKGYLSLELLARAQGGHSSVPRADSAIYRLAAALRVLEANPFPRQLDYLGWTAQAIAPELDFLPRLVTRNLWLFGRLLGPAFKWLPEIDAMTRTTTAPTMLDAGIKDNVQPTEARAVVNFRLLPGFSVEAARTRIAALVGPDVEVRALSANEASAAPSSMSGAGWQLLNASIQQAWHDVGGGLSPLAGDRLTVAPFLVMGGTDLKHYERIAKDQYRFGFLPMAKEDFRRLHGIDERVAVEALLGNIAFYHHLLRNAGEAP